MAKNQSQNGKVSVRIISSLKINGPSVVLCSIRVDVYSIWNEWAVEIVWNVVSLKNRHNVILGAMF